MELPYGGRAALPCTHETQASVLVLFGFEELKTFRAPHLLLRVRSLDVETHKGQISFPGGMIEAGESSADAALREADEELGLSRSQVRLFGELPELSTFTTGFRVRPHVGLLGFPYPEVKLTLQASEVAEVFWIPFAELFRPEVRKLEMFRAGNVNWPMPTFYWNEKRVWGATGAMLWNLTERWEKVGV